MAGAFFAGDFLAVVFPAGAFPVIFFAASFFLTIFFFAALMDGVSGLMEGGKEGFESSRDFLLVRTELFLQ
ncbi:MAG: hypothetical protein EOP88_15710 [Verrucomicrobiaceae bacterium]|nr:MAG: hypothetical protein EOP88_15710 [Verrucomicrobiaceae bacterium]